MRGTHFPMEFYKSVNCHLGAVSAQSPFGVGLAFLFTPSPHSTILSVFRLLPLRKLWANEYYVTLLKESLHVVSWMEMKHGAGPGEPLLLLSVTQQT